MTVPLERGVFYLRAEFLAHTFIFGAFPHAARAITAFGDKSVPYRFHNLFIFVKSQFQRQYLLIVSATPP